MCNPLLPAATVYTQLMAESKSRINSCAMSDKSRNVERCALCWAERVGGAVQNLQEWWRARMKTLLLLLRLLPA